MFEYSRALYRHVGPWMEHDSELSRATLLRAAETAVSRVTEEPGSADRLSRWLFREIRHLFALADQRALRCVISRLCEAAASDAELKRTMRVDTFGRPRRCPVLTRQGTSCRREPLPNGYCPSHQHLVEPTTHRYRLTA